MIQESPRRSETTNDEEAIRLTFAESVEMVAMVETEPEDPTGEAYVRWFAEKTARRAGSRKESAV